MPGRLSELGVITYGYNRSGTDRSGGDPGSQTFLGLGGVAWRELDDDAAVRSIPAITEAQVASPSDMFAIADSQAYRLSAPDDGLWITEDYLVCGVVDDGSNEIKTGRHGRGYNVVTCDGRVTLIKRPIFLAPSKTARNWNNDHEAHPETWPAE